MKAQASLCKCVNSTDPLLPAYAKYGTMCRIRPELEGQAQMHQHE